MLEKIDRLREHINIALYGSKNTVLRSFRILSLLVSIGALSLITYYIGFPVDKPTEDFLFGLIECSFAFYILHYTVRYVYDYHPITFLKSNWFEGIIVLLLLVEGISNNIFNVFLFESIFQNLGFENFSDISTAFVQVYLLAAALQDLGRRAGLGVSSVKLHPSFIFISIFVLIISVGTALLMLPEMTTINGSMDFLNALFTSTSATCVTGLILEDTATFFTFKGHFVIMMLIKLGGLNIIAFASFMALFSRFGFGVKHHEILEDFVNRESMLSSKGMFGKIVMLSLAIEVIATIGIFFSWGQNVHFDTLGDRIFHSVFHSISAFNNAGFSTFSSGLNNSLIRYDFLLHIFIGITIFFGSMGMTTLLEIFNIKFLRDRLRYPWKQISVSSRVNVFMALILTFGGAILFGILEIGNTLKDSNAIETGVTALFSSVTTRTAGFNTIDFSQLTLPSIILVLMLMFIGASSSSTGGGIKTSTFFLIMVSTVSVITGRKTIELGKRSIPFESANKAYAIVIYSAGLILISTFLLSITESESLESGLFGLTELFFEEVSAFSTVGLSLGVTPNLTLGGKIIIIVSMFVGRIGTLTFAYLLGRNLASINYKYPDAHILVG